MIIATQEQLRSGERFHGRVSRGGQWVDAAFIVLAPATLEDLWRQCDELGIARTEHEPTLGDVYWRVAAD